MSARVYNIQSIHLFTVCIPYGIVENVINLNEFTLHPDFPHFPGEKKAEREGKEKWEEEGEKSKTIAQETS